MRRYVLYAIGLAVAWVMLWDRLSVANVAAGALVATALLFAFPLQRTDEGERRLIRPLPLARLVWWILRELTVSNVTVALLILRRKQGLRSAIVACPTRTSSAKALSTMANVIVLSPGTMAVDALVEPPTIFIHVLTVDDPTVVRRRIAELEVLVVNALGTRVERDALAAHSGEPA